MYLWMLDGWVDGWMTACLYVCIDGCTGVYMNAFIK